MQKEYTITGMTCNGCVNSVKKKLESLPQVERATIDLAAQQGILQLTQAVAIDKLQQTIGHYQIREKIIENQEVEVQLEENLTTYKPLIMIVGFIAGITFLAQYPFDDFSAMLWMRHFMAGFFIVFAFFKLLNLEGFANSYQMYDIVAARWRTWGYIYPFVELGLGILYLINIAPAFTNWTTIIVLGVSSIGVIKSNLDKRQIKCACLGDVFNLPMSTVTIVEDLTMVAMAVGMLAFL
ncbi:MAG: MauE/DoxX family redox-associated membrane protein [Bacteroidota bacterium]